MTLTWNTGQWACTHVPSGRASNTTGKKPAPSNQWYFARKDGAHVAYFTALTIVLPNEFGHQVLGKRKVTVAWCHVCAAYHKLYIFNIQFQGACTMFAMAPCRPEEHCSFINVRLCPLPSYEVLQEVADTIKHESCVLTVLVKASPEFCIL